MPFGMPYCSLGYLPKWIAAFMIVACLSCASAQEAPIEAELSQNLAGDKLKIGSSFALQVLAPWEQAECRLASGALLHATVQTVTRTKGKTQGITFMVDAPCGERKPLEPVVTSLLAAPRIEEETEEFPGFTTFGEGNQPRNTSASLNPLDMGKPALATAVNGPQPTARIPVQTAPAMPSMPVTPQPMRAAGWEDTAKRWP